MTTPRVANIAFVLLAFGSACGDDPTRSPQPDAAEPATTTLAPATTTSAVQPPPDPPFHLAQEIADKSDEFIRRLLGDDIAVLGGGIHFEENSETLVVELTIELDADEVVEVKQYGGAPFLVEYYAWELSRGASEFWTDPRLEGWMPRWRVTVNDQSYLCGGDVMVGVASGGIEWQEWFDRCHVTA